ncbi:uncharacterized protein LOC143298599 [Babylonia areolata]|uniref:uncharacterized protein LOC143298599 n=1 Tax=Babylonia areolata TaxID=304850 RepID=UPI003FD20EC5
MSSGDQCLVSDWFPVATESLVSFPPSVVSLALALLSPTRRMGLVRMVRNACVVLCFLGRLLWVCVVVDTLFLAYLNGNHWFNPHDRNNNNIGGSSSNNNHNTNTNSNSKGSQKQAVSSLQTGRAGGGREFPLALVVASSTAAVSILLFFCLSYVWHTRQLDRRAQKLAIRLAAESEADDDLNCSQCRTTTPTTTYMAGSSQDSGTDSGGEGEEEVFSPAITTNATTATTTFAISTSPPPPPLPPSQLSRHVLDELNSLNEEDEEAVAEGEGEDGSRRKPGGVGRTLGSRRGGGGGSRRAGGGRRSGSRSSRKWSGHSGGGGGGGRSSMVTDQDILNHFASRRHSTFFI